MISNAAAEAMRPPRPHLRSPLHSASASQTYLSSDSEDDSSVSRQRSLAASSVSSDSSSICSGGILGRPRRHRTKPTSPRRRAASSSSSGPKQLHHRRCPTLEYSDDDEDSKFLKDLDSLIKETSDRWKLSVNQTIKTTSSGQIVAALKGTPSKETPRPLSR